MRDEGGVLNAWKERGLFLLTAAALAAYLGSAVLGGASRPSNSSATQAVVGSAHTDEKDQRYVRAPAGPALPADAGAVFAGADRDAYFDEALRRVWVEPKAKVVKAVMHLDPPPPMLRAPPMLLPVPGPALDSTAWLPRWPAMPAIPVEDEEAAEGEVEEEVKEPAARPRGIRRREERPSREKPRRERPRRERPSDEERGERRRERPDRARGRPGRERDR